MRAVLDFFEDVWDFILDHPGWFGAGAVGLVVLAIALAVTFHGCRGETGDGAAPVGRSSKEKSKDMVLDLGGRVRMDFVWLAGLDGWMGKYEVTNGEFRRFRPDHDSKSFGDHSLNGASQPVVFVSYNDAKQFAKWLNSNTNMPSGYTAQVPGRSEWLMAAQCGDGREFPWGPQWPPPKTWNYHWSDGAGDWSKMTDSADGFPVTCPVQNSGENSWGIFGMGGNALEWTSEFDVTSRGGQVLRGGSWGHFTLETLRCERMFTAHPGDSSHETGFRVCLLRNR